MYAQRSKLRRFSKICIAAWPIFVWSGPIVFFVKCFFDLWQNWPNLQFNVVPYCVDFLFVYCVVLLVVFIVRLKRNWRSATKFFSKVTFALAFVFGLQIPHFVSAAGFVFAIYPEQKFIKNHCHPINFVQDKKTFSVGVCDVVFDTSGQIDFSFVYDTSTNAENDEYARAKNNSLDLKEWVNALRRFFNDDPNAAFEYANFHSRKIINNFYDIYFDDGENADGFSEEYGPPPYDAKNPYHDGFYPAPPAPK